MYACWVDRQRRLPFPFTSIHPSLFPFPPGTLTLSRMTVTDVVLPSLPPSSLRVSGRGLKPEGTFYRKRGDGGREEGKGMEEVNPKSVAGRIGGKNEGGRGLEKGGRKCSHTVLTKTKNKDLFYVLPGILTSFPPSFPPPLRPDVPPDGGLPL